MFRSLVNRVVSLKTVLRIAITATSLYSMAHAQPVSTHPLQQNGNAYNFTAGGGG